MNQHNNSLSVVEINLSKIIKNYKNLKSHFGVKNLSAVLKSDAYGLGADAISKSLWKAGCKEFYVATIDEAVKLRNNLPEATIYTLHGINKGEEYYFLENKIAPVLISLEQMSLWSDVAVKVESKLPANIFFDTGMLRLGMQPEEINKAKQIIHEGNLDIDYVMSHIACGKNPEHPHNKEQLERFQEVIKEFPEYKTSFANSYALHFSEDFRAFDQARVGVDLYGVRDGKKDHDFETEVVFSIHTHIIQIHHIEKDSPVGYDATVTAKKGSVIATIPIGYADSYYFRNASKLPFSIQGENVYKIGATSMDLITLDVSNISEKDLFVGQKVEVMGKNISVETVSKMTDTVSYGIITSLGPRFKRNYVY
ncbi:MAG: alanine racemase [Rickettsiales bacterium]